MVMNIFDFEILLIWIVASTVSVTLFICLGHLVLNFFKISDPPRLLQSRKNSDARASSPGNMRKKIELVPTVICSLPIRQDGREEMPLS